MNFHPAGQVLLGITAFLKELEVDFAAVIEVEAPLQARFYVRFDVRPGYLHHRSASERRCFWISLGEV